MNLPPSRIITESAWNLPQLLATRLKKESSSGVHDLGRVSGLICIAPLFCFHVTSFLWFSGLGEVYDHPLLMSAYREQAVKQRDPADHGWATKTGVCRGAVFFSRFECFAQSRKAFFCSSIFFGCFGATKMCGITSIGSQWSLKNEDVRLCEVLHCGRIPCFACWSLST